jgi:ATP-dependent RNA helicase RhlE
MGFANEMQRILAYLPQKRQNLLFSATLNDDISKIDQLVLNHPIVIKIEPEADYFDLIKQLGYFVTEEKKGPLLRYLIQQKEMKQVLIFTSTTYQADLVSDKLRKHNINAGAIHSQKSQKARTDVLEKFKAGKLTVLVATDLISRGIDIKFLPYVINYELPRSPKDYIHRIGRTGRAESAGEALSFVTEEDKHHFRIIQKKMGRPVTMIDSEGINLHGF